jgi:hypothetical protein
VSSGQAAHEWPWAPGDTLNHANTPAWMDMSKGIWAPDMIRTSSGNFVVYFASALPVPSSNPPAPPSNDEAGTGATRVMYAAILTFGSDGYTPSVSFLAPSA